MATQQNKKETLNKVYSKLCYYLKQAYKGLRTNNVEEVQWWMGDLFTELCENKEMVDENIIKVILYHWDWGLGAIPNPQILYLISFPNIK